MVKHIGQAVAALTLKYTVQHAGIVTEKHRLIVMNALFLKQPRVEQLVPAQRSVKAAGLERLEQKLLRIAHAALTDRDHAAFDFFAVGVDAVARAGGQPHAIDLHGAVQRCKHGRFYQIIGIDHADVVAAGVVQSGVAGVGRAAVRLVEHPDAGILLCQCVADRGGAVVAAVIDKQQLKVGERLGQNALHSWAQVRPRVVDCGDYADFGMVGHRLFLI